MSWSESISRLRGRAARLGSSSRVRGEVAWVVSSRVSEYLIQFALLKILATRLGRDGYGEMNLAETAIVLATHVVLAPARESFLRDYHRAKERRSEKSARQFLLRWYACGTIGVLILSVVTSDLVSRTFGLSRWTVIAAGLVFFFDRWRMLAADIRNIDRSRKSWAIWNISFSLSLVGCITIGTWAAPATAATALFAYAAASAVFSLSMMLPWIRDTRTLEAGPSTDLIGQTRRFGLPFAALLVFQWIQGFTDRYLIQAQLDVETVGLYVAAFRVCGVPFMLILAISHSLLTPIAYQRSSPSSGPGRLWAADQVVLAGIGFHLVSGLLLIGIYAVSGPDLVVLLTTDDFQVSRRTVVALAAARLIQTISQALQPIFAVHERMDRLLWLRMIGAAATVAICWPMIARYGAFGAALGTLMAFSLYLLGLTFGPSGCFWLVRAARAEASPSSPQPAVQSNDVSRSD